MNIADLKINDFIGKLESAAPTPGGGSVSALAIALGISLVQMVINISVSKKKFKALPENDQSEVFAAAEALAGFKEEALGLADRDAEAYTEVLSAFKLPQESETEKAARMQAILSATLKAADVPLKTADVGYTALFKTQVIYPYAHKNAISDLGVGVKLITAGIAGAAMNVRINMKDFPDASVEKEYLEKIETLEKTARQAGEVVLAFVARNL